MSFLQENLTCYQALCWLEVFLKLRKRYAKASDHEFFYYGIHMHLKIKGLIQQRRCDPSRKSM